MVSNILSTSMIYNYTTVPLPLTWMVTFIYFIATPLMGVAYFYYTVSIISTNKKKTRRIVLWSSIPAILYLILVFSNPITKFLFDVSLDSGYLRGPLIATTYVVFYIYCFFGVAIVYPNSSNITTIERNILCAFPLLAVLVILIQQIYPTLILSGSAATGALLLLYLYLENKQISIDYLTNLPNRQVFSKMLELKMSRKKIVPFTVVVLSLKGFKHTNIRFGQNTGNLCLQQVAEFLKTIQGSHFLCRFSGDEFAIFMENTSKPEVKLLIDAIYNRMSTPWIVEEYQVPISSAIGVVAYQKDFDSLESIIHGIEYAVAQAKRDTLSTYVYCSSQMIEQANRKDMIIEILKARLENDGLEVHFQPIYDVKSSSFLIAESLLRLSNTPLGSIPPSEFIPIAEDTGLIVPMTYQILNKVCQFITKVSNAGVNFEGVSVNLSSIQFSDKDFSQKFAQIISSNEVPFSKIKIEITESVLIQNFQGVENFMADMHENEMLFGLDDFGTGYSNIATVLLLPWDTIKLDKSLIWAAIDSERSSLLVQHIARAFSSLGFRILAEGIETEEQRDFCISTGCDMIQGFLYAKPVCAEEAQNIFMKHQKCIEIGKQKNN